MKNKHSTLLDRKTISQLTLIIWNVGLIYRVNPKVISYVQGHFVSLLQKRFATRGSNSIHVFKAFYGLVARNRVSDVFVTDILKPHWLRRKNGDAFPKDLRFVRKFWKNYRNNHKEFLSSVLRLYSVITIKPVKDVSSITLPYTGHFPQQDIRKNFREIFKLWMKDKWRLAPFPPTPEFEWSRSLRAGPNRSPAIIGYGEDARSLYRDEPHLIELLVCQYKWHNMVKPERLLVHLREPNEEKSFSPIFEKSQKLSACHVPYVAGRLEFLPEGGGKTRVVALGDIFTQSACKPLHDHLMKVLRDLNPDCTFDQEKGVRKLKQKSLRNEKAYCFDLSNCTDRFPMFLQEECIAAITDAEYAWRWRRLMTDRKFYYVNSLGHKGHLSYSVGQPMGFLSSWPAMALAHHAVVIWSAVKALGRKRGLSFQNYSLLGDDIVIYNEAVAAEYQKFMEGVGVEINSTKSLTGMGYGEFCKRLIRHGQEVTPLPSKLLKAVRDYPITAPLCFKILNHRSSTEICEQLQLRLVPFKSRPQAFKAICSPLIQSDKWLKTWETEAEFLHFAELFQLRKRGDPEQTRETVYRDQLSWFGASYDRWAFQHSPLCEYFDFWSTRSIEGSWPVSGSESFLTWGIPSHIDSAECRTDYDEYFPPHHKVKAKTINILEPSRRVREVMNELSWQPDPWLERQSYMSFLNDRPELWFNNKFLSKVLKIRSDMRSPYRWD